jgi:hypothetical protein
VSTSVTRPLAERESALRGEALLRQILNHGAHAGVRVELLAKDARELLLTHPLIRRKQSHENDSGVHAATAESADDTEDAVDLRPVGQELFGAPEDAIAFREICTDGGLQAHHHAALIL